MADISKIKVGETEYDVKDATARTAIANFKSSDITYGYEDLVDGVSPLEPGAVYFYIAPTGPYRWYLVDGITEENVVAAYRFKGAETQAEALLNVNENGDYPLSITSGIEWVTGNGLFFPKRINEYISNTDLVNAKSGMITCVFSYSGATTGNVAGPSVTLTIDNVPMKFLSQSLQYKDTGSSHFVGKAISYNASSRYAAGTCSNTEQNGIIAGDWSNYSLYYNGIKQTLTVPSTNYITDNNTLITNRLFTTSSSSSLSLGSLYLGSLVFYNCVLTGEQHLQLATQINAL